MNKINKVRDKILNDLSEYKLEEKVCGSIKAGEAPTAYTYKYLSSTIICFCRVNDDGTSDHFNLLGQPITPDSPDNDVIPWE